MRFFYKVTKKRKKIPKLLILFCFVVFVGYFFWGGISNIDYKDAIFCLKYNYKKGKYQIVSIDGSLSKIRILKETHKDYSSLYHDIKNQRLFVRRSYDGRSPELIDAYSYKTSQLSSYIKTPGIHDVSLHKSNENLAIFSGIHDSGDLFLSIYGETGKLLHEEIIAPKTLSTASAENNKHLYFISYPHPYPKIKYEIPEFIEYDIESRKIIKKKPLPVKHIRSGKAFAIDLSRKNLFYGPFATDKEGGA
ncbi:MAG: hypothetical protein GY730_08110 [bacterium]|nr:hypothetical protein [bacterium]